MSWTTMDVGDKLEKAVKDVGRDNRTYLEKIVASHGEMTSILRKIEAKR